jgi:hypothetical protein
MNQLEALTIGITALGAIACGMGLTMAEPMVMLGLAMVSLWVIIEVIIAL